MAAVDGSPRTAEWIIWLTTLPPPGRGYHMRRVADITAHWSDKQFTGDTLCRSTPVSRPQSLRYPQGCPLKANSRCWVNAALMLGQRSKRWASIKTALVQRLVFIGPSLSVLAKKPHHISRSYLTWSNLKFSRPLCQRTALHCRATPSKHKTSKGHGAREQHRIAEQTPSKHKTSKIIQAMVPENSSTAE